MFFASFSLSHAISCEFPCSICGKQVRNNTNAIYCNFCKLWVHPKCNRLKTTDFLTLLNSGEHEVWSCLKCNCEIFPMNADIPDTELRYDSPPTSFSTPNPEFADFFSEVNSTITGNCDNGTFVFNDQAAPFSTDCKYYDISDFNSLEPGNLSFLHLNISSISKHFDNLEFFLQSLHHIPKVIAITETRIIKSTHDPSFNLPGFNYFSTPTEAQAGGTLLYISDVLDSVPRKDLDTLLYHPKQLESCFAEIYLEKQPNLIIGSIYRHPSMSLSEFNSDFLSPLLDKVTLENKTIVLLGDFNVNLLNMNTNNNISNFLDIMGNNLILPQIILPTRITTESKTLIDNIFITPSKFKMVSGNLTSGISDHLPQFLILKNLKISDFKNYHSEARNWKNFDQLNFIKDFKTINWDTILHLEGKDPSASFDSFHSTLTELLDQYAPTRKLSKNQIKSNLKPWITNGIKQSILKRDNFLKKFIKSSDNNLKTILYNQYKVYRNNIVNLIKLSKNNHYKQYFTENIKNSRKIWKGINECINKSKIKTNKKISLNSDGTLFTEPNDVANLFNKYFTTIADSIRDKIPKFGNFEQFVDKSRSPESFFFKAVTPEEMIKTIQSLNNSKASGPYSVPPVAVLNNLLFEISDILTKIINLSFETGIFPEDLKIAKVIPIFKNKGSNQDCNNYRPISLLSNVDKIFEKLVHSRLISYLNKQNILFKRQFGFRKGHSTIHTLINLTEEIRQHLENGQFSCGVFIDLQKAFDTVDHNILLRKLELYGIRGVVNKWFHSYLSNRKQYVYLAGVKSKILKILHGVPQGSVLGPLLFIIYINDLHNAILNSKTTHFADDTSLIYSNQSLKTIERKLNVDLKSLFKWLCSNLISLNVAKTVVVLFRNERKTPDYEIKLKLNGKNLDLSKTVKYLGITLDYSLSWNFHINSIANKLRNANGALSKLRHLVPKSTLITVYNALFSSHLTYACQAWAQNRNPNTCRLLKLQKQALRLITFNNFRAPSTPIFLELKLLKFPDLVNLLNLNLIHQIQNEKCPTELSNTFSLTFQNGAHVTRGHSIGLLSKPQTRTSRYGLNSVIFQSVSHWNLLQHKLKHIDLASVNLSKLQQLALEFFFDKYLA